MTTSEPVGLGEADSDAIGRHVRELQRCLTELDWECVRNYARLAAQSHEAGGAIAVAGNGGSAATSSHHVVDLSIALGRATAVRGGAVYGLAESPALLTALANDLSFRDVFARQVAARMREGDVLTVFSCSGTSPNVVRAAEIARDAGCRVVAMTGGLPSPLAALADIHLAVDSSDPGVVEDCHIAVNHAVAAAIAESARSTPAQ